MFAMLPELDINMLNTLSDDLCVRGWWDVGGDGGEIVRLHLPP